MSLIRTAARTLLAGFFVYEGAQALRQPQALAAEAGEMIDELQDRVDPLPDDRTDVVRLHGAVQVLGGVGLATNTFRRSSALALAGTLVPTTAARHRFWETDEPQVRSNQLQHLLKNAALLGGLLITAMDHEGQPGPAWRAQHAAEHASLLAEHASEVAAVRRDLAAAKARSTAAEARADAQERRHALEVGAAEAKGRISGRITQARKDTRAARRVAGTVADAAEVKGRISGRVTQARKDAKLGRRVAGSVKDAMSAAGRGARTVASAVTPG